MTLPTHDTLDLNYYSYVTFVRSDQIQSQIFAIQCSSCGSFSLFPVSSPSCRLFPPPWPPVLSSAVNSVRPGALLVLLESSCFVISSINHDKYHYHMCYEDVVDDDCIVIV